MLSSTSPRKALLLYPLGTCLPPLWSPLFPLHALALIPTLSSAALAHLDSFPPYDPVVWTDGSVPFPFGKGGSGVLANCSLCGTEATLSFSSGQICSSLSAEACTILQAICWSPQHQQFCHFSSPLQLSPPCPLLHFSFSLNSVEDQAGTVFSLLGMGRVTTTSTNIFDVSNVKYCTLTHQLMKCEMAWRCGYTTVVCMPNLA